MITKLHSLKFKGIIITTIVFFLLVNTSYYWEAKLGLFAFPAFFIFAAICLGLVVALLQHLYLAIREKFKQRERLIVIGLLVCVLTLTFFWPSGIINFDKLEGNDLLVAEREGGGDCYTWLKLKDNYTFKEKSICFSMTEISGTYKIVNDTIYCENIKLGRHVDGFYKFAVIKPSNLDNENILAEFVRYNNLQDTVGHKLWVTKNELQNLKDKNLRASRVTH